MCEIAQQCAAIWVSSAVYVCLNVNMCAYVQLANIGHMRVLTFKYHLK